MKTLEEMSPSEMPVMTITIDAQGKAWIQERDGEPTRIMVDFSIENEVERDFDAELRNGNGYVHWKPSGRHTLKLNGVWFDGKECAS